MEKLLTISVAAYNVEPFLENTLDSLADNRYVDKLEVFVVDDGGKDKSLEIAQKYEEKYPNTFHAVHKENGGYGSTVNYSITHATGKYFKLLDGDDWMNKDGLAQIINKLGVYEEDAIVTGYFIGPDEHSLTLVPIRNADNSVVKVKDYKTDFPWGMWALFYKTDVLKKSSLILPEHSLYTDQIYSTVPFLIAQNIRFVSTPVYSYRYGRTEQSTSKVSRIKHADEMLSVCNQIFNFYKEHKTEGNMYLFSRVSRYYIVAIRTILLFPKNKTNLKKLKNYEQTAKEQFPEIYRNAVNKSAMGLLIRILRSTNYLFYWGIQLIPDSLLNR